MAFPPPAKLCFACHHRWRWAIGECEGAQESWIFSQSLYSKWFCGTQKQQIDLKIKPTTFNGGAVLLHTQVGLAAYSSWLHFLKGQVSIAMNFQLPLPTPFTYLEQLLWLGLQWKWTNFLHAILSSSAAGCEYKFDQYINTVAFQLSNTST